MSEKTDQDKAKPVVAPRVPNLLSAMRAMIGRQLQYETAQGTVRTGKLTGVKTSKISIGGNVFELPTEFACDHDETDAVPLSQVIRIDPQPLS